MYIMYWCLLTFRYVCMLLLRSFAQHERWHSKGWVFRSFSGFTFRTDKRSSGTGPFTQSQSMGGWLLRLVMCLSRHVPKQLHPIYGDSGDSILGWKTTNLFLIASEPLGQNQHQIWFEKNKQLVMEVEPPNKSLAHQSIVESSIGVMPIPLFG